MTALLGRSMKITKELEMLAFSPNFCLELDAHNLTSLVSIGLQFSDSNLKKKSNGASNTLSHKSEFLYAKKIEPQQTWKNT
jgi:hypothetical protein